MSILKKINDIITYTDNLDKDLQNLHIRIAKEELKFLNDFLSNVFTIEQFERKIAKCPLIIITNYIQGNTDDSMYQIEGKFNHLSFVGYVTYTKTFISPIVIYRTNDESNNERTYVIDTAANQIINPYK